MTQEVVIEAVRNMPHEFNIGQLIERLIILEKIEEAEKDVKEGKVISHAEMKKIFEEWKK